MAPKSKIVITCDSKEVADSVMQTINDNHQTGITVMFQEDPNRTQREWTHNKYRTDPVFREKVKEKRKERYRENDAKDGSLRARNSEYNRQRYLKQKESSRMHDQPDAAASVKTFLMER